MEIPNVYFQSHDKKIYQETNYKNDHNNYYNIDYNDYRIIDNDICESNDKKSCS